MYTCWDCARFGAGCKGILHDDERRNEMEKVCKKFLLNPWKNEMSKIGGRRKL
ncbi:MAG: hypothetical protein AB1779_04995 [Candidatus Thermoplasmatota archaeon]